MSLHTRSAPLSCSTGPTLPPQSLSVCKISHSARMRNLSALLFVLLLCSLQLVSSGTQASKAALKICCPALTQMKLPLKRIVSYNWTSSECSIKAVVFNMISGKTICVDPASDWVNDHVKAVDQRTKGPATGN
ncbi:C-C motif chemokine 13-like [Electrophorus electricus]|nr:C-C motif chemokine 13-like [Electrophorus electricus]